ncbi:MAG: hypothetical protein F7C34_04850 [Desulfurococcales archaeon]|nr:hypothetical protein [Desulfurococcales archaeon]
MGKPRLVVATIILTVFLITSYASTFVYVPATLRANTTAPVVRLWEPLHEQVKAYLGDNLTSIISEVNLTSTPQLLDNNEFNGSLDSWTCGGNESLRCIWLPSDTGAIGGAVQITGSVVTRAPGLYSKSVEQIFMVPENISGPLVGIRYAFPEAPRVEVNSSDIIIVALFNWTGSYWNTLDAVGTRIYQTSSYNTIYLSLNATLKPGEIYLLLVGYGNLVGSGGYTRGNVDFRVDSVSLSYASTILSFGGEVLRINTTIPAYMTILVTGYTDNQSGLYGRLYFFNGTTIVLVAIIENGTITYTTSYFLRVDPTGDQYNASARLWLEANTTRVTGDFTIFGVIEYTNGAYYVFYPFEIRVHP